MKWAEMRRQFPGKFVVIGDVEEERISQDSFRVLGGKVLMATDDPQVAFKAYREHKGRGENVLYSLPTTPEEFVVTVMHRKMLGRDPVFDDEFYQARIEAITTMACDGLLCAEPRS